ncbi:MAG: DMT family transporter, partial [Alphaproteobacteria bacterium]|nr:DMT family transporter [Alphaproteobacteria bacterium]
DGRFAGGGQANMEFLLRAWIVPTPGDLALFAASGFTVAIGGFAISQAYRLAAATTVAPFEYLALPLAVLWGYLIWGDFPDLFTFLGIALIVVGGLTVILRSRAVA